MIAIKPNLLKQFIEKMRVDKWEHWDRQRVIQLKIAEKNENTRDS